MYFDMKITFLLQHIRTVLAFGHLKSFKLTAGQIDAAFTLPSSSAISQEKPFSAK